MKKQDRQTTAICIRLDNDTISQLDYLCTAFQCKRSEYIASNINGNYDKMVGSPIFNEMMATMNCLTEKLKKQALEIQAEQQTNGKH